MISLRSPNALASTLLIILIASGAAPAQRASTQPRLSPEVAALLATIVEEVRRPNYHSRDTVYVLIGLGEDEYICQLSTGSLALHRRRSGANRVWRCGRYAEIYTNILDRNMRELAQGGGQLLRLESGRWRSIATAEGEYSRSTLRNARMPQSVLDCLGIEALNQ